MNEPRRLTPQELRAQQEQRERETKDAKARAEQQARDDHAAKVRANLERQAVDIQRDWYDIVIGAARREHIRFVVLAHVTSQGGEVEWPIDQVKSTVEADGYACELVTLHPAPTSQARGVQSSMNLVADDREGNVFFGNEQGWKPANVPKFGTSGSLRWLIARW